MTVVAVLWILTSPLSAAYRFYLAEQHLWENKQGWYLDLEGDRLTHTSLILAVADGKAWRFVSWGQPLRSGHRYTLSAVITPNEARLAVDNQPAVRTAGAWQPSGNPVIGRYVPTWASEIGDWMCLLRSLHVRLIRNSNTVGKMDCAFSDSSDLPPALQYCVPPATCSAPLAAQPGDTLELVAEFEFLDYDLTKNAPFIDRYGQSRHARYKDKVSRDEELVAEIARENAEFAAAPPSSDYDCYGGYKPAEWHLPPTGFFRLHRKDRTWWLISPDGNPCFYMGVCALPSSTWETTPVSGREYLFEWIPPHEGPFKAAWSSNHWGVHDGTEYVCLHTCNLIRKYGPTWGERAVEQTRRRMKSWGFSGGAKWGGIPGLPEIPVLGRGETPCLAGHPDVFDATVCLTLREALRRQIEPRRRDPWVLGWSLGNEYDEIIKRSEIRTILQGSTRSPAKKALIDHALDRLHSGSLAGLTQAWRITADTREQLYCRTPDVPPAEIEVLRRFYAERYYATIYKTVKSIDSDHLYLGFWIVPGWWEDPEDWRLIAAHCDIIGYDRYAPDYEDARLRELQTSTDKPTFCGEFSFPAWYEGTRAFGRYGTYTQSDEDSGRHYARWVEKASQDPYCVGLGWFTYRDQPLTGRGPGKGPHLVYGENYAFGLIDELDRPKRDMIRHVTTANHHAVRRRLKPF